MKTLEDKLFSIQSAEDFERVALEVYDFQVENCQVYHDFVKTLNRPKPTSIFEIPFIPISFFKSHQIVTKNLPIQFEFHSSGTTGTIKSKHFVQVPEIYNRSFEAIYKQFIGNPTDQVILALLPNYIEQGHSSLVYMVEHLIQLSNHPQSGFYLNNYSELIAHYQQAIQSGKQVVIFGVAYALLDLAEQKTDFSAAIIIETGGMKGRRKELTKEELHEALKEGLNCTSISSEYGMTELFSQSYSRENGIFDLPPWMQILIREMNDPFHFVAEGKTGGINVIDLANLYSCSFIETQDLGKKLGSSFQLLGRFDLADIRGCNLMVE